MDGYRNDEAPRSPTARKLLFDAFLSLTMVGMGWWLISFVFPGRTVFLIGVAACAGVLLGYALQLKRLLR